MRSKSALVAAIGVAAAAFLFSAWPTANHWIAREPDLAWVAQADLLGMRLAGTLGVRASEQPEVVSVGVAVVPGYQNPLRDVSGLVPERIDMGVDFRGSGPVYALGNAVVTNATANSAGWPGGGWITYQLTDGPDAGLTVYLAEDVSPTVQIGQRVSSATVIGNMFDESDGIETGWAQPSGLSAESQLSEAGGVGGNGPFPTRIGLSFEELLQSMGVPAAPNRTQSPYGMLPAGYPPAGGLARSGPGEVGPGPSAALTMLVSRPHTGPGRPDPDNRGAVQHILALSRSAVTIRHWFEINLDDASMEHGARIEIRELARHPHRGSESASQLTTVDRPLWRADLFDRLADPPGSFSVAHYHPEFTGNEPSARFWDTTLTSDPWAWLGDQITTLGTAAGGARWPLDPADSAELPGLASAVVATAQQFAPAECRSAAECFQLTRDVQAAVQLMIATLRAPERLDRDRAAPWLAHS